MRHAASGSRSSRCVRELATQGGWDVELESGWIDIVAKRQGLTVFIEAKGVTTSPGLDTDTAFGQLLRRMRVEPDVAYAIVGPNTTEKFALRVPAHVLDLLRIGVYSVDGRAEVRHAGGPDLLTPAGRG